MRLKKSTAWFTARTSETGVTSFICGGPFKNGDLSDICRKQEKMSPETKNFESSQSSSV